MGPGNAATVDEDYWFQPPPGTPTLAKFERPAGPALGPGTAPVFYSFLDDTAHSLDFQRTAWSGWLPPPLIVSIVDQEGVKYSYQALAIVTVGSGQVAGTEAVTVLARGWIVVPVRYTVSTHAAGQVSGRVETITVAASGAVEGTFEISTAAGGTSVLRLVVAATASGRIAEPNTVAAVASGTVSEPGTISTSASGAIIAAAYLPSRFKIWNGSAWV